MTLRLQYHAPAELPPANGYSQVVTVEAGRLAFVSGQVGVDCEWRLAEGFRAQADLAFANLLVAVAAAGGTRHDIAKLTIFVRDNTDHSHYAAAREAVFGDLAHHSASTFVVVAGLYDPDALIEIEAVVALP